MALIVQKYGGTSVGTVEKIENVAEKLIAAREAGHDVVVVVSAMSGETNRLIELAQQVSDHPHPREYDVLVSTGEQVTIALLSMILNKKGYPAVSYTGAQVHILTDSAHTKARILDIDESRMREDLDAGRIVVVAGFQGRDEHGHITTLGRGGSDTTVDENIDGGDIIFARGAPLGVDKLYSLAIGLSDELDGEMSERE